METALEHLGLEGIRLDVFHAGLEELLRDAGPALVRVRRGGELWLLAVVGRRGRSVEVVAPDLSRRLVPARDLASEATRDAEESAAGEITAVLGALPPGEARRARVRRALLAERLRSRVAAEVWTLALAPGSDFRAQLEATGVGWRIAAFVAAYTASYALLIASWAIIGRGALAGSVESGWIWGWGLVLGTLVLLRLASTWAQGLLGQTVGVLLKKRLLWGAFRLDPAEIRHEGLGRLLGRAIEAGMLEMLATSGAFVGVLGAIEITVTLGILLTAGKLLAAAALLVVLAAGAFAASRYLHLRSAWAQLRLHVSHTLIESMVGYRTRLAQEPRARWHRDEDADLSAYFTAARRMNAVTPPLFGLVPRGWVILGLLALAPEFVASRAVTPGFAAGLLAVLLGYTALRKIANSAAQLADAAIAWREVAPTFHAAARPEATGTVFLPRGSGAAVGEAVAEARAVAFRHPGRAEAVLAGCDLALRRGDRVLLEGPSGGGKSTLVSMLAGLRAPDSGLLLVRGLDRPTLGLLGFRAHVALAPQFHENHILSQSLAFNLLMGRRWPPVPSDLADAQALCEELGLGDVLARMPAGLFQMVGEAGWQLSHGERSRVFLARALLQGADAVILDESLAALDGATMVQALGCAARRAPALLVIAHL